jgi:5-methylcytosine-specific restriction endonuclease McrA
MNPNHRTSTFNRNRDMGIVLACAILVRDGLTCVYCHAKLVVKGKNAATLDHIIPRSMGGLPIPTNLVTACVPCNRKKQNKLTDHRPIFRAIEWAHRPVDLVKGRELALQHYSSRMNRKRKVIEARA